jgi:uncharacterized OB-fold protein
VSEGYGDALTRPFWAAAARGELVVQRCASCGHHQLYPRPFCLGCDGTDLAWVETAGTGTVYSRTVVHMQVSPDLEPPYSVALVELDEGPRVVANLADVTIPIGARVRIAWRARPGLPPYPSFEAT